MPAKVLYLKRSHICPHCVFRKLLSSVARDYDHLSAIADDVTRCHGPYQAGDHIYRVGDPFRSLMVVQQRAVKTEILSRDGSLDVTGFYLVGELFGYESIGQQQRCLDAVALSDTWLCEAPFYKFESLCLDSPALQAQVFSLFGDIIRRESHELRVIRNKRAEQRVLWFLNDLQQRVIARRGDAPRKIPLPMLKDDMARYLSLTPETLSRVLTGLQRNGLIRNHFKSFEILDMDAVHAATGD